MVALALVGCAPRVSVTSLGEPDLDLPAVRALATAGEGAPGEAAAEAFGAALERSPRMRLGEPADATVSFLGFEAGSADEVTSRTERDGDEQRQVFTARRTVAIRGTIELTSAAGATLERLEDVGTFDAWEADGDTAEEATAALPPVEVLAEELGASAGIAYARRVAPLWTRTTRTWYASGDPRLRAVAWTVRAGDWDAARRAWGEVAGDEGASVRARARALVDLAVAHELDGDVHRAWTSAREAADLLPVRRIEEYRDSLDALRAAHRPLLRQVALPGSGEATGGGEDG